MSSEGKSLNRRTVLRGAAATAALVPLTGVLAACAGGGTDEESSQSKSSDTGAGGQSSSSESGSSSTGSSSESGSGSSSATGSETGGAPADSKNPFGVKSGSTVNAVVFDGGYGTDYVTFAAKQAKAHNDGVTFDVKASTKISTELQPTFVAGNPPDVFDNSGEDKIGVISILDQLSTLDDVFAAPNYEGKTISDTLYGGVKKQGTFSGEFKAINYVMTLYAIWYSGSLFEQNGWTPPKTWDEAIDLGMKAKEKKKYLWIWGKEASSYYLTLALDSAIKEGGDEVRLAFEKLDPKCWSQSTIQKVFTKMKECVDKGLFKPGGAGTQFTAAQAQWSMQQEGLLYPSGSWIENEMSGDPKQNKPSQIKKGFEMKGVPEITLTDSPKLPYNALRAGAGEPYLVPSTSPNPAGGKELLRAMLSHDAATNFVKTRKAPTIVAGTVPPDGFGSTALVSQSDMLDAAGDDIFNYQFVDYYGLNSDQVVFMNSFLSGQLDVKGLTEKLQKQVDDIANDSSVKKLKVTG